MFLNVTANLTTVDEERKVKYVSKSLMLIKYKTIIYEYVIVKQKCI